MDNVGYLEVKLLSILFNLSRSELLGLYFNIAHVGPHHRTNCHHLITYVHVSTRFIGQFFPLLIRKMKKN